MYKNIQFILLIAILFASCSETVLIDHYEGDQLLIECELNPSKQIRARLTTLSSFQNTEEYFLPEDAEINIFTGKDIKLTMLYNDREKYYYIPVEQHTINPEYQYRIEVKLPSSDNENKLTAVTNIPLATNLITFNKSTSKILSQGSDKDKTEVTLNLQVPNPNSEFYRLKVYRKIFIEKTINGEVVKVWNGKTEPLEFITSVSDPLCFHKAITESSILINTTELKNRSFSLKYKTTAPINTTDKLDHIYYEFETLTEATYRYNVSKIKQLNAEIYGNTEPVINYTNATNGFGFLGASNGVVDSIEVK